MRFVRRRFVAGLLLAVALGGLAACRTDPNVAAYVGDARISEAQLDDAVHQRLEDKAIAAYAKGKEADFTRRVLGFLVDEQVYRAVADRYSVTVSDRQVRSRIETLLNGQDPQAAYDQLAQQGISREDVVENVRQQLIRQEVAKAEGLSDALTEEGLRAAYEQQKESLARKDLGYILVPDQATADAAVAQLNADPRLYSRLAARFPGQLTLPAPQPFASSDVPQPLAEGVASAKPNTAFAVAVPDVGGVVVAFVGGTEYPTFEQARPQLESQAASTADDAATKVVDKNRDGLDITVNPRYGVENNGKIEAGGGGVVKILQSAAPSSAPTN
ncbi:MAG: SurA N-terminal domain-containing protein [Ornithinibacter sp.]